MPVGTGGLLSSAIFSPLVFFDGGLVDPECSIQACSFRLTIFYAKPLATSAASGSVLSGESSPAWIRRLNKAAPSPNRNNTNPIPITLAYSFASSVNHPKNEMPARDVAVAIAV